VSSVLDRHDTAPDRRLRGMRVLVLGIIVFVVVLTVWVVYAVVHPAGDTLYPVDLGVYRDGGLIVRHVSPPYDGSLAHPLYDWPVSNEALKFTYTPFAALFFAAVSFISWSILPRLSEVVNLVALLFAAWCTMGALGYRGRRVLAGGALLGTAAGLLTEPVFRTMYLGQINILLMAAVIWDLCQPDTSASRRWKGIATGIAAGIKLVPLIFIPYLLLTRKFRQAGLAIAGFAGTVLLGFIILPGDSADWWFQGLFFQDGRTGFVGWGGNQSLRGIVTRLAGSINAATVPWVIAVLVVTVLGLLAAAMLDRSGHVMLGLLMAALVGLLDSPISWDHHWVWVVPGMMAAAHYGLRAWNAGRRRVTFGCAAVAVGIFGVYFPWPGSLWSVYTMGPGNFTHGLIWAAPNSPVTQYVLAGDQSWFSEYHWHGFQLLAGNAYILAGLALFAVLGFVALASYVSAKTADGPTAGPADPADSVDPPGTAGIPAPVLLFFVERRLVPARFLLRFFLPPRTPGPLDRASSDQHLGHRPFRHHLPERVGVHRDMPRFILAGQVEVKHRDPECRLLDSEGLVGERLDFHRAIAEVGVLMQHDARECVVAHDELSAQIAESNGFLSHA
jgi:alpha-1,2-mannosyltransferase